MLRKLLLDDQWHRIAHLLPGKAGYPGCAAKDNRLLGEAVLWVMRTGIPWWALPPELGSWHSTSTSVSRVGEIRAPGNVWPAPSLWLCRPWSCSLTRPCSHPSAFCRRPKKAGGEEIGRSQGGLTTKLRVAVNALGNTLRIILSAGQARTSTRLQR